VDQYRRTGRRLYLLREAVLSRRGHAPHALHRRSFVKARGLARSRRRCPPAFSFVLTLREDASRLPTGKEGLLDLVRDVPYPFPLARCTFLSSSLRDLFTDIHERYSSICSRVKKSRVCYFSGFAFLSFFFFIYCNTILLHFSLFL